MSPLDKELFALNVRTKVRVLLDVLNSEQMRDIRKEHTEVRLPRTLRNHLIDLSCDFSQFTDK